MILVKLEHPKKVSFAIAVIESGSVIEVKEVQYAKAPSPIDITELGIIIVVKLVALTKVWGAIADTSWPAILSGITNISSVELAS